MDPTQRPLPPLPSQPPPSATVTAPGPTADMLAKYQAAKAAQLAAVQSGSWQWCSRFIQRRHPADAPESRACIWDGRR